MPRNRRVAGRRTWLRGDGPYDSGNWRVGSIAPTRVSLPRSAESHESLDKSSTPLYAGHGDFLPRRMKTLSLPYPNLSQATQQVLGLDLNHSEGACAGRDRRNGRRDHDVRASGYPHCRSYS